MFSVTDWLPTSQTADVVAAGHSLEEACRLSGCDRSPSTCSGSSNLHSVALGSAAADDVDAAVNGKRSRSQVPHSLSRVNASSRFEFGRFVDVAAAGDDEDAYDRQPSFDEKGGRRLQIQSALLRSPCFCFALSRLADVADAGDALDCQFLDSSAASKEQPRSSSKPEGSVVCRAVAVSAEDCGVDDDERCKDYCRLPLE